MDAVPESVVEIDQRGQQELAFLINDQMYFLRNSPSPVSVHDETSITVFDEPSTSLNVEAAELTDALSKSGLATESKLFPASLIHLLEGTSVDYAGLIRQNIGRAPFATVILFIIYMVTYQFGTDVREALSVDPKKTHGSWKIYPIFTYAFVHLDDAHLIINLVLLTIYGSVIEIFYGRKLFLWLTAIAAVAGSLVFLASAQGMAQDPDPLAGASAILFGYWAFCVVTLAMEYRTKRDGCTRALLVFSCLPIALLLCYSLMTEGSDSTSNSAHCGGVLVGVLFAPFPHMVSPIQRYIAIAHIVTFLALSTYMGVINISVFKVESWQRTAAHPKLVFSDVDPKLIIQHGRV